MACWLSAIVMVIAIICAISIVAVIGAGFIWIWIHLIGKLLEKYPFLGGAIIVILVTLVLFWLWLTECIRCIEGG